MVVSFVVVVVFQIYLMMAIQLVTKMTSYMSETGHPPRLVAGKPAPSHCQMPGGAITAGCMGGICDL